MNKSLQLIKSYKQSILLVEDVGNQQTASSEDVIKWSKKGSFNFQRAVARILAQNNQEEIQILFKSYNGDKQSLKLLSDYVDKNFNNQQNNQDFLVKDPTNTRFGKIFASHVNSIIPEIQQDEKYKTVPLALQRFISTLGMTSSFYEFVNSIADKGERNKILRQNYLDVSKLLGSGNGKVDVDKLSDEFQKYLFANIKKHLNDTDMQFSSSMSSEQKNKMLWIRASKNDLIGEVYNHRIYINTKPVASLNTLNYIATIYTKFNKENQPFAPFVYVKAKVRTDLSETDRADTCIFYLKVSKRLNVQQIQSVVKWFEKNIGNIPEQNLNGIASEILPKVKGGITSVMDDVQSDKGESYTSQIGKSLSEGIKQIQQKAVSLLHNNDLNGVKELIQNAITYAVKDLKSKNYPVE